MVDIDWGTALQVGQAQGFINGPLAFVQPLDFSLLGEANTVQMFVDIGRAFAVDRVVSTGCTGCGLRPEHWDDDGWLDCGGGFDPDGWNSSLSSDPEPLFTEDTLSGTVYKEPAISRPSPFSSQGFRLRPRGRLTRSLQVLGQCFEGWWRDLPGYTAAEIGRKWLYTYLGAGVKLGKSHPIGLSAEGESACAVEVVLEHATPAGQCLWICPELVASLSCVRVFRGLSATLLPSLRSRARLWAKDKGMSDLDLSFVLPGSCALAVLPGRNEVAAVSLLGTDAARWGVATYGQLDSGRVDLRGVNLGFWGSLRRALRWTRPTSVLQPTCTGLSCGR